MSAAAAVLARSAAVISGVWDGLRSKFPKLRWAGYTKLEHRHRYRLSYIVRGEVQSWCVQHVYAETIGASGAEWSRPITMAEFAAISGGVSVNAVEPALKDACARGLLERKGAEDDKRGYRYRALVEDWEKIPQLARPKPVQSADKLDSATEQEPEDTPSVLGVSEPPLRATRRVVSESPVPVKPRASKVLPLPVHATEVEIIGSAEQTVVGLSMIGTRIRVSVDKDKANTPSGLGVSESDRVENTKPVQNGGWSGFFLAVADAKLSFSRVDLKEAERIFQKLSIEDQLSATQGIRERLKAGEFQDPRFRPRPDTYLAKRAWERPIRSQKNGDSEGLFDRAMKRAREYDHGGSA